MAKDLIMTYARSAVDEHVSHTQFQNSLPEILQLEVGTLEESSKSSQESLNRRFGGSECYAM